MKNFGCSVIANSVITFSLLSGDCSAGEFSAEEINGTLHFSGILTSVSIDPIHQYISAGGRRLVITSAGGEVLSSIKIANEIREKNVDLVVNKYCFSACANYLFIAAKSKYLPPSSVIGFHGAPILNSDDEAEIENFPEALKKIYNENKKFYASLKVDTKFLIDSDERTRLRNPIVRYLINGGKWATEHASEIDAAKGLHNCMLREINCSITIKSENNSVAKAYFPSRETLEKQGVSGISEYSYPRTQIEMIKLAKQLADGFELVGDF
jgi:hypothetical protein